MLIQNNHSGQFPIIIHAPDWNKNYWWTKILRTQIPTTKCDLSNELTIITWNNQSKGQFETSLELRSIPYTCLGSQIVQWSNYYKLSLTLDALKTINTEFVMGCDSHDVIICGSPKRIVEQFRCFTCDLLFNSEKYFYPDFDEPVIQRWKLFEFSVGKGKFRYLNSGAWIGRREFCLEFFTEANKVRVYDLFDCERYQFLRSSSIGCDQSSIHHIFSKFFPKVQLDYDCVIFQNIANINKNDISIVPKFL